MIEIELTQGKIALIDDQDWGTVKHFTWYAAKDRQCWYAKTEVKGSREKVAMHRLIMQPPPGVVVDHISGNGLDNRRSNLRLAMISQNHGNRRKDRKKTSRYKGVSLCKLTGRWRSQAERGGVFIRARFATEVEAALAYDSAARLLFGEFACLNFPLPGERSALLRGELGGE